MELTIDTDELQRYRDELLRKREIIIDNANKIRTCCMESAWNDEVYEKVRQHLNAHFKTMDNLLSGMDNAVQSIDEILRTIEGYFRFR